MSDWALTEIKPEAGFPWLMRPASWNPGGGLGAAVPWRPWLLNVTVHDGVVELWGIANSAEEKAAAGVAVENAPGVLQVNNHVIVRPHKLG